MGEYGSDKIEEGTKYIIKKRFGLLVKLIWSMHMLNLSAHM